MATKYVSSLTGEEMDAALIDMAYHNSEAYAVGTRNGVAVGSSDVTYHNNAKYYAEQTGSDVQAAEAAAARAEAAVPAGTAGAVFFDRAQSLTTAQQAQARTNIMAGGSNRNLLDNPWFTVNQRGWTNGTASNVYTVDRWKTSSSSSYSVTVNSDGTLTVTGLFYQKFEPHFISGQIVTISYMDGNGNVTSKTGTIGTSEGYAVGNAAFGLYYRPSTGICDFQIQASNLTLRACKCELGSVSTLANDAPPNYVEELTKCKAYFERIGSANRATYGYFGTGVAYDTTHAIIIVPMTPKIGDFSITSGGSFRLNNRGSITVTSLAFSGSRMTNTAGVLATASGLTAGSAYLLQANNDSTAYIDITSTVFD